MSVPDIDIGLFGDFLLKYKEITFNLKLYKNICQTNAGTLKHV